MSYFLHTGNRFQVSPSASLDMHETLPGGTYSVKYDDMHGFFFLEQIEDFKVSGKIYGKTQQHAARILDTFDARDDSTGVMLSGEKGSGKTLLAKLLSTTAMAGGTPTIVIDHNWFGTEFNNFMQLIDQPCIVIFDEFEKVYKPDEQEQLLTLLDGVYQSKKLFIITCNDKYRVNDHMKNRPGRLFYRIDYKGLDEAFITEYCNDNLENKSHIETLCNIASLFDQFNFDMLKAIVEEMNRYNESPQDAMEMLNAKPEFSDSATYSVVLEVKGESIPEAQLDNTFWSGNPFSGRSYIDYTDKKDKYRREIFSNQDLVKADVRQGKFHYENHSDAKLTLTKVEEKTYNWREAY